MRKLDRRAVPSFPIAPVFPMPRVNAVPPIPSTLYGHPGGSPKKNVNLVRLV